MNGVRNRCTDHLGNLPVETTLSPLQPTCASPLPTGDLLHPWLTVIPKMVSSALPNFFSNAPKTSQTEKQTLKRKPNHTLMGYMGSVPILPGYGALALRRSMATPSSLKFPRHLWHMPSLLSNGVSAPVMQFTQRFPPS